MGTYIVRRWRVVWGREGKKEGKEGSFMLIKSVCYIHITVFHCRYVMSPRSGYEFWEKLFPQSRKMKTKIPSIYSVDLSTPWELNGLERKHSTTI